MLEQCHELRVDRKEPQSVVKDMSLGAWCHGETQRLRWCGKDLDERPLVQGLMHGALAGLPIGEHPPQ